jgi:hypothetical protein
MATTVVLYDPTAPRQAVVGDKVESAHAPVQLSGAVVGFIDNAKPNFNYLVDDLAELLQRKYGVQRVLRRRKPSASVPATAEVIDALAEECDMVITGSGD